MIYENMRLLTHLNSEQENSIYVHELHFSATTSWRWCHRPQFNKRAEEEKKQQTIIFFCNFFKTVKILFLLIWRFLYNPFGVSGGGNP